MNSCPNGKQFSAEELEAQAAALQVAADQTRVAEEAARLVRQQKANEREARANAAGAAARARVLAQDGQQCCAFVPRQPTALAPTAPPAFANTGKKYPWWQWAIAVVGGMALVALLLWGLASVMKSNDSASSKGVAPLVGAPAPTAPVASASCAPTCFVPQVPVVVNVYAAAGNSPEVATSPRSRTKKGGTTSPVSSVPGGCNYFSNGRAILKGTTEPIPEGIKITEIPNGELVKLYPDALSSKARHKEVCHLWSKKTAEKLQIPDGLRVNEVN